MEIVEFLLARIAEDEKAAKSVPPLGHNFDMGGKRQDERFVFHRLLPSSLDGMGNDSKHQHSPTTDEHFGRYAPDRVLAECEAKRQIISAHSPDDPRDTLCFLALIYADHPDFRDEWRP